MLDENFTPDDPIWHYEDPQEVLFTDLILFHGGNLIIFPEVLADSHVALGLFLCTIFMEEAQFSSAFREDIDFAASCLLNMSTQIARRLGYDSFSRMSNI